MRPTDDHAPGTVRTGGRSQRNRQAVLAAALQELNDRGFGGLSAARIAERAGVHRTTVHRRWPDLGTLVVEALTEAASGEIEVPDTGSVQNDLTGLLRSVAARIGASEARRRIRGLISDAARSAEINSIARRFWTQRFELGEMVIQRGINRGEIRGDIAPMTTFSIFIAPLYLRVLITDEPLDHEFIDSVVALGLRGATPTPGRQPQSA